jgi:uncharacterized protein (TIGR02231 family)
MVLCFVALPVEAHVVKLSGEVQEATVYRNGADVTKVVEEPLESGDHTLYVPLPDRVNEERLRVYSDDSTRIRSFRVDNQHHAAVTDTRIRTLKKKIRSLERDKETQQAVVDANRERLKFLENFRTTYNKKLAEEQLAKSFSTEEYKSLTGFIVDDYTAAREAIIQAKKVIRSLETQINAIERRLDQLRGQSAKVTRRAVIELSRPDRVDRINGLQKARLELVYGVPNAGWSPSYDLRVNPGRDRLTVNLYGLVKQNTGEKWSNVDLSLSTGRPRKGGGLPKPDPLFLEPPEQEQPKTPEATMLKRSSATLADKIRQERTQATNQERVEVGPNVTFPSRQLSSLPSDGTSRRLKLIERSLSANLRYRTAPLVTDDVYLWVNAKNTMGYPLPPGSAEVYVDDAYVGEVSLGTVLSGDTLATSAGVDQRIAVNREKLVQFRDSTFWSGKSRLQLKYEITVKNGRPDSVPVTIIDRVPVSRHEKINVTINDLSSPNRKTDDGLIYWKRHVPGEGKETLSLTYTVTVPQGWESVLPD